MSGTMLYRVSVVRVNQRNGKTLSLQLYPLQLYIQAPSFMHKGILFS